MIEIAKQYSHHGFSVIPVSPTTKNPTIGDWIKFQTRPMTDIECEKYFKGATGIALLCGGKKRVFALDFDTKYDLSGDLWERYKEMIPVEILKKLMCQKTQSGGYHLLAMIPESRIRGNEKLASRYTTAYEKHQTYLDSYRAPKTRDKALKVASNDKYRVLVETRGGTPTACGGYVLMAPTKGYEFVYGKIQEITEEEYDILVEAAKSLNEIAEVKKDLRTEAYKNDWKVNPFDHYNEEGEVVDLLVENGWDIVGNTRGRSIRLRRPGQTHSKSSALFDTETRVFNCFSSSTMFECDKGYTASSLFIELECDGDTSEAYKKLIEKGYGIK